jgi:hypothetical protein
MYFILMNINIYFSFIKLMPAKHSKNVIYYSFTPIFKILKNWLPMIFRINFPKAFPHSFYIYGGLQINKGYNAKKSLDPPLKKN